MPTPRRLFWLALCCLPACSSLGAGHTQAGPEALIPHFVANDPLVETAGFVAKTLRLKTEREGVTYTLMTFVVGKTLTLGAMVKGGFDGRVQFRFGERSLSFPMNTEASLSDVPVAVSGRALSSPLVGQGATFRGTSWVNIEVPAAEWIHEGSALQLVFEPAKSTKISLPDSGHHYVVKLPQ